MMIDQNKVRLKYLNHVLRNGTTKIQGCLKNVETILREMNSAIVAYEEEQDGDIQKTDH